LLERRGHELGQHGHVAVRLLVGTLRELLDVGRVPHAYTPARRSR